MKTYYIYGHWTKDTKELFYIGVGTGPRISKTHGRNRYWYNIVAKHGYIKEIILDGFTDRDEAVLEEIRLQELNKPRACINYGDNHNRIMGKEQRIKIGLSKLGKKYTLGYKHTKETKRKISESNMGQVPWNKGKEATDITKKRMSDSHKGRKCSEERVKNQAIGHHKTIINCRGSIFKSVKDATTAFSLKSSGSISTNLKGKQKSAGKYSDGTRIKWRYYNV